MAPARPLLLDSRPEHARVVEILEHYVDPALRHRLREPVDGLRLGEDLGIDSLSVMEAAIRLEDAFQVSLPDEELRRVRTLGDVRELIDLAAARRTVVASPPAAART